MIKHTAVIIISLTQDMPTNYFPLTHEGVRADTFVGSFRIHWGTPVAIVIGDR